MVNLGRALRPLSLVLLSAACRADLDSAPRREIPTTARPASHWAEQLDAPSPRRRQEAARALGSMGLSAALYIPKLVSTLGDSVEEVGTGAAWALTQMGDAAVPPLIEILRDRRAVVRTRALYALGEIGRPAHRALPAIESALNDPGPRVRAMAEWALGEIQPRGPVADPTLGMLRTGDLKAQLRSPSDSVRLEAVNRVWRAEIPRREGIPVLIQALGDPNPQIRARAGEVLVSMGPHAGPALQVALRDSNATIRKEAALLLSQLSRSPF